MLPQKVADLATECHVIKDQSTDKVLHFMFYNQITFI